MVTTYSTDLLQNGISYICKNGHYVYYQLLNFYVFIKKVYNAKYSPSSLYISIVWRSKFTSACNWGYSIRVSCCDPQYQLHQLCVLDVCGLLFGTWYTLLGFRSLTFIMSRCVCAGQLYVWFWSQGTYLQPTQSKVETVVRMKLNICFTLVISK